MLRIYFLAILATLSTNLIAQKSPLKYGEIDVNNLAQKTSLIDSTSGAEYILDHGVVTFDHSFEIELTKHVRIKIFDKNQFDLANIEIPYSEGDNVTRLKASTYNLVDDKIVESTINKKEVFTENVTDGVKQKRLSMPEVREGSIIEYSYSVNYGGWRSLPSWYFQRDIPVRHSEYIVSLPEYFEYKQIMTGYVALHDFENYRKNGNYKGQHLNLRVKRFVAKNVMPFKDEPHMTSRENYISQVSFALYAVNIPGEITKQYLPENYPHLSWHWSQQPEFGKQITNAKFLKDQVSVLTSSAGNDLEKVKSIYYFVRDSIENDEESTITSLRNVYLKRTGNGFQVNRLLAAMLHQAGLQPEIVRLSTRSNGYLHPNFPIQSKFNYTLVSIILDGEEILMDARKNLPFGMIPDYCLNGKGMVISENNFRWIPLESQVKNQVYYAGNFKLEDGYLAGNLNVSRGGYNAFDFREANKEDLEDYIDGFAEDHATWTIDNHEIEGVELLDKSIKHKIAVELEDMVEEAGDLVILKPIILGQTKENPFKTEKRVFPVNFGSPHQETMTYRFMIPEGMAVEEVPAPVAIGLPDNAGTYVYKVQQSGQMLVITSVLKINKVLFSADDYPILREFYGQLVAKQNESVVLKMVN